MKTIGDIKTLVKELGGTTKLAAQIGVVPSSVSNMIADGHVYSTHQLKIYLLAKEAGLKVCPELLGQTSNDDTTGKREHTNEAA